MLTRHVLSDHMSFHVSDNLISIFHCIRYEPFGEIIKLFTSGTEAVTRLIDSALNSDEHVDIYILMVFSFFDDELTEIE